MIRNIALKNLRRSERNVRTTAPQADIECLAADILARGILQNLVVIPTARDRSRYDVTGGGRRLAALHLLLQQGHITSDYPVPCLVRDAAEAEEDSLAENIQRIQMHPADAFVAFAGLVERGKTVEDIATRFGLPSRIVSQRLKLGRLSPRLLNDYRLGKLSLDHCEAFTLTDDHALQESAYDALSRSYGLSASQIRQHLAMERVPVKSKLGAFVVDAYVQAGFPVTTDLFAEDGRYLDDHQAAVALATDRLQQECDRLVQAEGWAWARPLLEYDYTIIGSTRRTDADVAAVLSDEDRARRLAFVTEHNAILSLYRPDLTVGRPGGTPSADDGDSSGDEEGCCPVCGEPMFDDGDMEFHPFCSAECEAADDEAGEGSEEEDTNPQEADIPQHDVDRMATLKRLIADIDAKLKATYSAAVKARAGCWVLIGSGGALDVREGYLEADNGVDGGGGQGMLSGSGGLPSQRTKEKRLYSAALANDLAAHRTQAFQVGLADNPDHAMTYLLYTLWARLHYSCTASSVSTISAHPAALTHSVVAMDKTPAARALSAIGHRFASLIQTGQGSEDLDLYRAIHGLSSQERSELLAYLMAQTVAVDLSEHGGEQDPVVEHIGQEIGVDPAKWWRPTALDFFGRVSKAYIMSDLGVLGRGLQLLSGKKKTQITVTLDSWFANPEAIKQADLGPAANNNAALPAVTVQAIQSWLPVGMAFAGAGCGGRHGARADAA